MVYNSFQIQLVYWDVLFCGLPFQTLCEYRRVDQTLCLYNLSISKYEKTFIHVYIHIYIGMCIGVYVYIYDYICIYMYTLQLVTAIVSTLRAAARKFKKPRNVCARTGWTLFTWTWKRFAFPSLPTFRRRRTFMVGAPFFLVTTCNPMVARQLGPTKCHWKGQIRIEAWCRTCTSSLLMRPSCLHDATSNHYMTPRWPSAGGERTCQYDSARETAVSTCAPPHVDYRARKSKRDQTPGNGLGAVATKSDFQNLKLG